MAPPPLSAEPVSQLPRIVVNRRHTDPTVEAVASCRPTERAVAAGRGKMGHASWAARRHCAGATFGGAKIWNSENWPLLANCPLHAERVVLLVQQLMELRDEIATQ